MTRSGDRWYSSLNWTERKKKRAVGAVGQHASSKSKVLSPESRHWRFPGNVLPYTQRYPWVFSWLGLCRCGLKPTRAIEQRDAAQRGVRLAQLHDTLATAVIDVQGGQYEPARQLNQRLLHKFTPPDRSGFRLSVHSGAARGTRFLTHRT